MRPIYLLVPLLTSGCAQSGVCGAEFAGGGQIDVTLTPDSDPWFSERALAIPGVAEEDLRRALFFGDIWDDVGDGAAIRRDAWAVRTLVFHTAVNPPLAFGEDILVTELTGSLGWSGDPDYPGLEARIWTVADDGGSGPSFDMAYAGTPEFTLDDRGFDGDLSVPGAFLDFNTQHRTRLDVAWAFDPDTYRNAVHACD